MNTLTLEKHCWAEIDLTALRENYEYIRRTVGGPVCAVVKADAYGHGDNVIARVLQEAGAAGFAVSSLGEGRHLRRGGITTPILILGYADPTYAAVLAANDLITTCYSTEYAQALSAAAVKAGVKVKVHLKIDTGMGRYGFLPEDMNHILGVYREQKNIAVSGVYTHFNCAFGSKKLTHQEFETFQKTVSAIREAGFETGTVHCCNSSAFLRFPEMHCDGVRLGSAILGRVPFHTKLRPVGYAEAHVEELRVLPKGHPTGYGAMWTAREDTPVAIVPIGWYNGFRERCDGGITRFRDCLSLILRGLRGIFFRALPLVEVNGHKCRVVGQIGMLHIAVDVRGIECKPGDRVIVPINPLHVKGMKIQYR